MLRTRDRDPPRTRAERPCQRLARARRHPRSGDPVPPSPQSTESDRPDSRGIEMRDTFNSREETFERCETYRHMPSDDNRQYHCEKCKLSSLLRLNNCQCSEEFSGNFCGSNSVGNVALSVLKVLPWRGVCDFGSRSKRKSSAFSFMFNLLLLLTATVAVQGRGVELPRYETAYACEGKTLKIECRDGEVIHLIRANYGRFSITICNDHGNTDWSVNCMSTKSLRVLHNKCSMNQNCSIVASTNTFGDPCPNTLKYLEAHYQCIQAATTSSTIRPSPPWLITSQPSVWRSTVPTSSLGSGASNGAGNSGSAAGRDQSSGGGSEVKNNGGGSGIPPSVHHLAPPTFRPHITMPPDLRPGIVKVKNDGHSPEVIGKPAAKLPPESTIPIVTERTSNNDRTERPLVKPKDEEQNRESFTEDPSKKKDDKSSVGIGEQDRDTAIPPPPHERDHLLPGEGDGNRRHHHHNHHDNPDIVPNQPLWRHCSPQSARGLQWNWTTVGEVALQPCPGGATGLARWRCVSSAHKQSHLQQQRRLGAPSRDTGSSPQGRAPLLLDGLGSDTLLTGRDIDTSPDLSDFRAEMDTLMLPDSLASSAEIDTENQLGIDQQNDFGDGQPVWISENPDLSECRSVWLNSLETRVKEGESLLSISNDLSQVTSSKTLYGGDMMTTTNIMKRLAQRMALNIQSFADTRQREAIVTDLLLGVVKTGSNLLDISQQASWKDLSHPAQMRVATSLLIGLEENAFLLAEAVLREKTIVHQMKNIVLSVRVLEARHVETEEFPSAVTKEQWTASQDTIHLPRGALIDNSEGGLVRIVFVAFDRLEEILQPLAAPTSPPLPEETPLSIGEPQGNSRHQQMNSQRDRDNITRVINSKVISASLGKGRHIQLSQPVRLTLRHLRTDNVTNPTCVFWDYTVNVWSAEGCRVEWTNSTHTGCQCSHLTNFALLMDVHAVPLSPSHALALHLITVIGCAISAVALFAAMIVFHCFKGMKTDRITIHKNLCACLLIAEVIFMLGVDRTANRVLCGVIAAFLHYFFLAAFAWMFLEGFQLYAMLVEVFEPERARARWYYPAAYITPLVIVVISGAIDSSSYGTAQHCWLRADNYFILSFLVPVAVVLVANWLCLFMVIYMMCRHSNVSIKAKENNKLHKIKVWLRSSVFLAVLLGLTWTFGLLYLNEQTIFMAYAFSTLNSLQGLFIFIFHCLQNETFQKECGRLGRQHSWLSCCLRLAPATSPPAAGATGSSSAPQVQQAPTQQTLPSAAKHSGRHHHRQQHQNDDQCLEDVSDMDHNAPTSTSSKHQAAVSSNSLQHPDHARRIDPSCRPLPQQLTSSRHDTAPRHAARQHHYHPHSYSEISRHRRGSEEQYRDIHDDPVYEEIERNVDNTLMSDISDDNSGHGTEGCIRQADLVGSIGHHHGNLSSKFYGDHRPLISYSPGERHRYDRSPVALDHHTPHGKYSSGRWDGNMERHVNMEQGRPAYGYRPKERALAAVLNGDNDVASRVLCHGEHARNMLQAYSDDI